MNVGTGEIAAHVSTEGHADNADQAPGLFRQAGGCITNVTADAHYNSDAVYQAAVARQHGPPPDVVISPGASAASSTNDPAVRTPQDCHVRRIAEQSRTGWQRAIGYSRRKLVEISIGRHNHLISLKLRARTLPARQGETAHAVKALTAWSGLSSSSPYFEPDQLATSSALG